MKKYSTLNLILFILFLAGTTMTMYILYKDIDNPFSYNFIIGYVIYLILYGLFSVTLVVGNVIKLNGDQIRKRIFTFMIWFILLTVAHFLISYLFRRSEMDAWDVGVPLGVSFAMVFSDLMSWKQGQRDKHHVPK